MIRKLSKTTQLNGANSFGSDLAESPTVSSGQYAPLLRLDTSSQGQPQSQSSIVAPQMTTISDAYKTLQGTPDLLPSYSPISSFGQDYYDNLYGQASKRLSDQYFNTDSSLSKQLTNQMNKRGLIGSGIEAGSTLDLYNNFGSQLADVSSELATQQAKNDLDAARYNAEMENKVKELSLAAAGDEAKRATDFNSNIFKSQVESRNSDRDYISKQISDLVSAMSNTNIDPDTRDYYESIFGTNLGDIFGTSYEDYLAKQDKPVEPVVSIRNKKS